jgi:transcriptional regulator GlxA family with amidase domain
MTLQTTGSLRLDADGERVVVGPGQLVLSDMARPEIYEADAGSNVVLHVPRGVLDAALARPVDLHGLVPRGAGAAMLADYMRTLVAGVAATDRQVAPRLSAAAVQLLAAAIVPVSDGRATPAIEHALLRQACRHVEQHLDDPELSAAWLCARLRVSRATLYRLFEPLGGVASHVRERRLARIHAQLVQSPGRVHLGRIADQFGFHSASHFSQAFRQHFGYSPSEARDLAQPAAQGLDDEVRFVRG